jgi:hypothetical protein
MAFDALQNLGEEKLATIMEALLRGERVKTIARTIQQDWGDAQGLSRVALERELTSLRLSMDGGPTNNLSEPSTIPDDGLQVSPLHALAGLVQFQATRINWLHKKELAQGKPLPALAQAVRDYGNMLPRLQEMRFDCGVDKYMRVELTSRDQQVVEEAGRTALNKQVSEAVDVLQDVFKKRNIAYEKKIQ